MAKHDIEADFPLLVGKQYDLSAENFNFNCLAFALGDESNWWEPPKGAGQYWPPGFPDDLTIPTVEAIIRCHGFTVEIGVDEIPEADAIAIYSVGDEWSHFAKFANDGWRCKLGIGHDVIGFDLHDLETAMYGKVVKILRRPLPPSALEKTP